jgi:hypothetical protein
MKDSIKFLSIIAIVAVIWFSLVACDDPNKERELFIEEEESEVVAPDKSAFYGEWISYENTDIYTGSGNGTGLGEGDDEGEDDDPSCIPYTITISENTIRIEDANGDYVQYANVKWNKAAENTNAEYKEEYPAGYLFPFTINDRTSSNPNVYTRVNFRFIALAEDGESIYVGINASEYFDRMGGPLYLKDIFAPELYDGAVNNRFSHTEATIRFYTYEEGTAYYLVQNAGDPAPTKEAVRAGTFLCEASEGMNGNKPVVLTAGAKDIYVVVQDAAGNISEPLHIPVAAFVPALEWTAVPAGTTVGTTSTFGTTVIESIAYGNGTFVAVGRSGKMAYSADGTSWTAITATNSTFGTNDIYGITYGGEKFIAVGEYGNMAYSANGTGWTAVNATNSTFGSGNDITGIAYGGEKFVAVGTSGKMAYSANGTSWSPVTNSTFGTNDISGIAYGDGKFVAVSENGRMAYSADGTSWTAIPAGTTTGTSGFSSSDINGITYGNGTFVAVGESGKMAYSTNGTSWTAIPAGYLQGMSTFGTGAGIYDITYGGGRFVATGYSGQMAYSADGVIWTGVLGGTGGASTFGDSQIWGIAYGGGRFVAVGHSGKMAYSNIQE